MPVFTGKAEQDLSVAALQEDFDFPVSCKLVTVYLRASVPITEDVTVSFISKDGSSYDTQIDTDRLTAEQDYVYQASGSIGINEGDKVRVECTNANTTGTVYTTVKTEARTR